MFRDQALGKDDLYVFFLPRRTGHGKFFLLWNAHLSGRPRFPSAAAGGSTPKEAIKMHIKGS